MAEIEANDGFCGQICGRIPEMTTRIFTEKQISEREGRGFQKYLWSDLWSAGSGEALHLQGKRRISQINKICEILKANNYK